MNFSGINSASLNGGVFGLVLAEASTSSSASVNAFATHQMWGVASIDSNAAINAIGGFVHKDSTVVINGTGSVNALGYLLHDALASNPSNCNITAVAIRSTQGVATANGGANAYASPVQSHAGAASIESATNVSGAAVRILIGQSNISGSVGIIAIQDPVLAYVTATTATADVASNVVYIHRAKAIIVAGVEITPNALRTVLLIDVPISLGNANLRGEPSIKKDATTVWLLDGYGAPTSDANLVAVGVITKIASASGQCTAATIAEATRITPVAGFVESFGFATIKADATNLSIPFAQLGAIATVAANAVRIAIAISNLGNTGSVVVISRQQHAGNSILTTGAILDSSPIRFISVKLTAGITANLAGTALRNLVPILNIGITADINAVSLRTTYAKAVITTSSNVGVIGASIYNVIKLASANMVVTAIIEADTIANPLSYDPEERTFYSTKRLNEFTRPFIDSEFKRAA